MSKKNWLQHKSPFEKIKSLYRSFFSESACSVAAFQLCNLCYSATFSLLSDVIAELTDPGLWEELPKKK